MDGEDYRTGSADSENGSDNSYVQVSKEDAQHVEPLDTGHLNDSPELVSGTGMSTEDYTLEEGDSATTRQEAAQVCWSGWLTSKFTSYLMLSLSGQECLLYSVVHTTPC